LSWHGFPETGFLVAEFKRTAGEGIFQDQKKKTKQPKSENFYKCAFCGKNGCAFSGKKTNTTSF
jgi:hypothetical protein